MKNQTNKLTLILTAFMLQINLAGAGYASADQKITKQEIQQYLGTYTIEQEGSSKIREIITKNEQLYYVVDDQLEIPLVPESKTKFNLYPSATYLYFEFDENGEITGFLIKKGSGGVIKGRKIKEQ